MRRMLSCEQLVTIYLGDERPLPTPLLLLLLEYSGLVHLGQRSMSFWVFCERPRFTPGRRPAARSRSRRR